MEFSPNELAIAATYFFNKEAILAGEITNAKRDAILQEFLFVANASQDLIQLNHLEGTETTAEKVDAMIAFILPEPTYNLADAKQRDYFIAKSLVLLPKK